MENKLFKVTISTYYFGNRTYNLYVLAKDWDEALKYVHNHPSYKNDEDAEIEEMYEIASETTGVV